MNLNTPLTRIAAIVGLAAILAFSAYQVYQRKWPKGPQSRFPGAEPLTNRAYNVPSRPTHWSPDELPFDLEDFDITHSVITYSEGKRKYDGGKLWTHAYQLVSKTQCCTIAEGKQERAIWNLIFDQYDSTHHAVEGFNQHLIEYDTRDPYQPTPPPNLGWFITNQTLVTVSGVSGMRDQVDEGLTTLFQSMVGADEPASGTLISALESRGKMAACGPDFSSSHYLSYTDSTTYTDTLDTDRLYNSDPLPYDFIADFCPPYMEELDLEITETSFPTKGRFRTGATHNVLYSFSFKKPACTDEKGGVWYNRWRIELTEYASSERAVAAFNLPLKYMHNYNVEMHNGNDSRQFVYGNTIVEIYGSCRTTWFVNDAYYRLIRLTFGERGLEPLTSYITYCGSGSTHL